MGNLLSCCKGPNKNSEEFAPLSGGSPKNHGIIFDRKPEQKSEATVKGEEFFEKTLNQLIEEMSSGNEDDIPDVDDFEKMLEIVEGTKTE